MPGSLGGREGRAARAWSSEEESGWSGAGCSARDVAWIEGKKKKKYQREVGGGQSRGRREVLRGQNGHFLLHGGHCRVRGGHGRVERGHCLDGGHGLGGRDGLERVARIDDRRVR